MITSAALIMTVVFLGFVANPSPMVTMLGRANWWFPGWLDRRLPRVGMAGARSEPEPVAEAMVGR